jgi:hypothetical protein
LIDPTLEAAIRLSLVPGSLFRATVKESYVCTLDQIKGFPTIQRRFDAAALPEYRPFHLVPVAAAKRLFGSQ